MVYFGWWCWRRVGGGCDAERTRPSITAARALYTLIQFARRIVGKSNFFKARQESNVFYIFTKSSSRAEKPRLMLSHFARSCIEWVWKQLSWKRVKAGKNVTREQMYCAILNCDCQRKFGFGESLNISILKPLRIACHF